VSNIFITLLLRFDILNNVINYLLDIISTEKIKCGLFPQGALHSLAVRYTVPVVLAFDIGQSPVVVWNSSIV
jgi:hypothetical protein